MAAIPRPPLPRAAEARRWAAQKREEPHVGHGQAAHAAPLGARGAPAAYFPRPRHRPAAGEHRPPLRLAAHDRAGRAGAGPAPRRTEREAARRL
ncbi:hypothetical protein HMPREF0731_1228, partial [Pseudoroseomonas cervicalis ATCC 49957]